MKAVLGFLLDYWAYIAAAIVVAGFYFWVNGLIEDKRDAIKALADKTTEFEVFKSTTAALGVAAQEKADKQAKADQLEKEKKDALLTTLRTELGAVLGELRRNREARSSSGFLPPAAAQARDPEKAEIIRSKFERAMGYLDEQGAGIAERGDGFRIELDSLKD